MGRKEKRIVLASDHSPIRVGDKIVLEAIGKKSPKITIEELATTVKELAQEMRQGFIQIREEMNTRFNKLDARIDNLVKLNNLIE